MKKVGIITFHNVPNYGAFLQAYALQTTLSSLNYDSVIINYINPDITNRYMPIDVTNFLTLIKSFFKIFIKPQRVIKYYIFQEQINKYMVLTDKIKSRNDVVNEFRKFDVLITGSDQVWNSDITNGLSDLYTLNINDKSKAALERLEKLYSILVIYYLISWIKSLYRKGSPPFFSLFDRPFEGG